MSIMLDLEKQGLEAMEDILTRTEILDPAEVVDLFYDCVDKHFNSLDTEFLVPAVSECEMLDPILIILFHVKLSVSKSGPKLPFHFSASNCLRIDSLPCIEVQAFIFIFTFFSVSLLLGMDFKPILSRFSYSGYC